MADAAPNAEPYPTLGEMKAHHRDLLRTSPTGESETHLLERVREFLTRGAATGSVLDDPADRRVAQGLLDYWKATLYTTMRDVESPSGSPGLTILVDFPETKSEELVARAEAAVAKLDESDREVARRILLRLVRLPPAVHEFHSVQATRVSLDDVGNVGQVARVVRALDAAGVVRTSSATSDDGTVNLAAAHLVRTWPRYAEWLKDRLALRTSAYLWQQQDRHASALVSGPALAAANTYRDLDALEAEFLEASRKYDDRNRKLRLWAGFAALAAIIVVLISLIVQERNRRRIAELKDEAEHELAKLKLKQATINARVTNVNRMMRALSEIVVAPTTDEQQLTLFRWKQMDAEVRSDQELNRVLTSQEEHLRIVLDPRSSRDVKGFAALEIANALRNQSLEDKDEFVINMLMSVRSVTYHTAEEVTRVLLAEVNRKGSGNLYREDNAFVREYWRLYWGPLGMVESEDVEEEMVAFGNAIKLWKAETEVWLKQPEGKKGEFPSQQLRDNMQSARDRLLKAFQVDRELKITPHRSTDRVPKGGK